MRTIQRTYLPGSQWVYFKIYTGKRTADELLFKYILPMIKGLKEETVIKKWFFIRYSDPDFHLRLRLLVIDVSHVGIVISMFYSKFISCYLNGLIWKVQLDTYDREVERYGKDLIEEAESIFCIDSECIIDIIKRLKNHENYRWMVALKLIDSLLSAFSFDIFLKQQIMSDLSDSFKKEFGFDKHNSKQFNSKYRDNKQIVELVLNGDISDTSFLKLLVFVKKRSKPLSLLAKRIIAKLEHTHRDVDVYSLIKSYIHMMLNRLFLDKNRIHELVIYDFMNRYYKSQIARDKYKSNDM